MLPVFRWCTLAQICVMFFVQYATNSGLVATYHALKTNQPILLTWRTSYLWTSISLSRRSFCCRRLGNDTLKGVSIYAILLLAPGHCDHLYHLQNVSENIESR
jgi:hypothetical protein